jgi:hypothetical protein
MKVVVPIPLWLYLLGVAFIGLIAMAVGAYVAAFMAIVWGIYAVIRWPVHVLAILCLLVVLGVATQVANHFPRLSVAILIVVLVIRFCRQLAITEGRKSDSTASTPSKEN